MKVQTFEDKEGWLAARRGKITGSRLKDIIVKRGTGYKVGYYELIAERLADSPDDENPMDRGTRLEGEAIERFVKETGKKVDTSLVLWIRDDNESIAVSPDGIVSPTEAVEVKCLASARHVEAYLTKQIPPDYQTQVYQYFIVNDRLKTLNFLFYDPRMAYIDFFMFTIQRKDIEKEIQEHLEYEKRTLAEVDEIVLQLSGF